MHDVSQKCGKVSLRSKTLEKGMKGYGWWRCGQEPRQGTWGKVRGLMEELIRGPPGGRLGQ